MATLPSMSPRPLKPFSAEVTFGINMDKVKTRLYVQGGMGAQWESEEMRDFRVQMILSGGGHPVVESLTPAERADLAVAFIQGWAQHRGDKERPEPLASHRLYGQDRVQVCVS